MTVRASSGAPPGGSADVALAALYALTLVGFPLVSTLPVLLGLDSQLATVPYRLLVVLLSFAILYGWWLRGTRLLLDGAVLVTLLLWTLLVARMLHDTVVDPLPGQLYMPAPQLLLLSFGGCFLPALAGLEAPGARTLELARRGTAVLGLVAMLMILYFGVSRILAGVVMYRLETTVLNPISVGHLGVSVLIVALCGYSEAGRLERLWRALLTFVSVVVVVASVSRGPILAALVAVLLLAFATGERRRVSVTRVGLRVVLISAALAAIVWAVLSLQESGVIDVVTRLAGTLQDVASQERAKMIEGAWRQFTDQPLTGSAFVELRFMENPHNVVLESLMALGVPGLGLLLASMAASLVAAVRVLREAPRQAWVPLVYLQYLINALLSGSLFTDGAFWLYGLGVMALASALPGRALQTRSLREA